MIKALAAKFFQDYEAGKFKGLKLTIKENVIIKYHLGSKYTM